MYILIKENSGFHIGIIQTLVMVPATYIQLLLFYM